MKRRFYWAFLAALALLLLSGTALAQPEGMTIDTATGTLVQVKPEAGGLCRVPEGVRQIAPGAFGDDWHNDWVRSLSLPLSLDTLEPYAFASFTSMETVALPLTLREIPEGAFRECIALTSVLVPPSVKTIGALAFNGCFLLREAYLPDGLVFIDPSAFAYANEDLIIYASEGSEGHAYAKAHGLNWAEPGGTPVRLTRERRPVAVINLPQTGAQADIRETPSGKAASLARHPNGTLVELIAQEGDWWLVGIGPLRGYLPAESLMPMDPLTNLIPLYFAELHPDEANPTDPDDWESMWPHTYTYPGTDAPRTLSYDNPTVDILDAVGPWLYVDAYRQNPGYMPVTQCTVYRHEEDGGRRYGIVVNPVASDRLNLRDAPKKSGTPLGRYFNGTQVEILGEENGWYHVRVDGKTGYMLGEFVYEVLAGKHWWEDDTDPNG